METWVLYQFQDRKKKKTSVLKRENAFKVRKLMWFSLVIYINSAKPKWLYFC